MRILLQKEILTSQKLQIGDFIDERNSFLALKNNAPFTNCISKINNVLIDNAEDLNIIMPMYNLLEYSKNYSKQQEVCGIITKISLIILLLTIIMQIL